MLAGFAIFSILGHMANVYNVPVEEVVKDGQTDRPQVHRLIKYIIILYV